ncbi:MAG: hypothetical protein LC749_16875 [Actinobacteria bacterium]|nr:hypothetical protein [Actinomycetota bacterium]
MRIATVGSRRRIFLVGAAGLAVVTAVSAPTAVLAAAAKTTGFVGETAGGFIALTVSRDGRELTHAGVAYTQKCSDGDTITDWDTNKSILITAARTFSLSFDTGPLPSTVTPGTTFDFAGKITGKLNKAHTSITGTIRYVLSGTRPDGKTYTCDTGTFRYTAKD